MKNTSRFLLFVLTIATLLLSACGGTVSTPTVNPGVGKVEPIPVAFIGVVDSIAGDQWVINGQTVTVSSDVLRDGPFDIGDQVKVEGLVNADGSFTVAKVESPSPQDSSSLPQFGSENANSNESNTNDGNINAVNTNDDNSNSLNSNDGNTNEDNGNSANTNDDNSNSVNSNDTNSNDDNVNNANSNDDHDGNSNSDDDNGNDDHSGSGGDNNGGNNGNGGGSDDSGGGGNDDNGNGG